GHSLSARRGRDRDRHQPGRVLGLLRRPHRRRGIRRPADRAALLLDVDAESHFPDRLDPTALDRAPRGKYGARRRLGGGQTDVPRVDSQNADSPVNIRSAFHIPHFTFLTLDRYLFREWVRVFLITLFGFPILVIVIDLTDRLDTYLGRGIKPGVVALSYVFDFPEKMFLILPVAVLFATVFTVGALGRHSELTAAKASGIYFDRLVLPLCAAGGAACALDAAPRHVALSRRQSARRGDGVRIRFAAFPHAAGAPRRSPGRAEGARRDALWGAAALHRRADAQRLECQEAASRARAQ